MVQEKSRRLQKVLSEYLLTLHILARAPLVRGVWLILASGGLCRWEIVSEEISEDRRYLNQDTGRRGNTGGFHRNFITLVQLNRSNNERGGEGYITRGLGKIYIRLRARQCQRSTSGIQKYKLLSVGILNVDCRMNEIS